jgi:predicted amidohydrolase YtcJ
MYKMNGIILFTNGIIETGTGVRAEAMLVRDGRIIGVGSDDEMRVLAGGVEKEILLNGHYVMPGFVDSHIHLMAYGFSLQSIDLSGASSIEEIQKICRDYIAANKPSPEKWIIGRGWNQNLFPEKKFPEREALDGITQDHPLLLLRVCGHIATVNSRGLRNVYPSDDQMSETMKPWLSKGIVLEDELEWFKTKMEPKPGRHDLKNAIMRASERLLAYGVTSVHAEDSYDLGYGGDFSDIKAAYQELMAEKRLSVRIYQKISLPNTEKLDEWLLSEDRTGMGNEYYKIGPMKLWLDGTLGGRTAAVREPYADDPGNRGMLLYEDDVLESMVTKAHENGMQICLHAIGDAALNQAVTVFEKIYDKAQKPLHHRIIHCQIGDNELYGRMAAIGLTGDIQFSFTASDWSIVTPRLGAERAAMSYAWKSLLDAGVALTAGSDCPVEIPNPFIGLQAAVTRKDLQGNPAGGFNPAQALSLQEAIRIHTLGSAAAAGEAAEKGTLEPGKLADFIALSHNPYDIPSHQLTEIKVHAAWVSGESVYQHISFNK